MKTTKEFIIGACFVFALFVTGVLLFRHYSVFPLTVLLDEEEMIGPGSSVTLDEQIVGRVGEVELSGGKQRSAKILIDKREVFARLQVGLVRVTGDDVISLATGLCAANAPRLERSALVPSVTPAGYFARRYLDPNRWGSWVFIAGAAASLAWIFRRPLTRMTN